MRKTIQLSKWLLAAVLLILTASGCGPRSQKAVENVTDLLSRKEKAIQTIDKVKSEKELGLVEYEIRKVVKARETGGFIIHKNKAIICACKAYLKAGIDLSGFDPMTDVAIDPDETMITITLPSPTLLSVNMPIDSLKPVRSSDFCREICNRRLTRISDPCMTRSLRCSAPTTWASSASKSISRKKKPTRRRQPWISRPRTCERS